MLYNILVKVKSERLKINFKAFVGANVHVCSSVVDHALIKWHTTLKIYCHLLITHWLYEQSL